MNSIFGQNPFDGKTGSSTPAAAPSSGGLGNSNRVNPTVHSQSYNEPSTRVGAPGWIAPTKAADAVSLSEF